MPENTTAAIDRSGFWKFNWKFDWKNYLIDVPFLLFSVYFFATKAEVHSFSATVNSLHFAEIFSVVVLVIAWNCGNLYARYEMAYKGWAIFVRILLLLFGFTFIIFYWISCTDSWVDGEGTVTQKFLAYFAAAYLLLIPLAYRSGLMTGRKNTLAADSRILKFNAKLFCWTLALAVFILIPLLYWKEGEDDAHDLKLLLAMLIVPIAGGIVLYRLMKSVWRNVNKSLFEKLFAFIREIIVPLLIGTSLAIYFQLGISSVRNFNHVFGAEAMSVKIHFLIYSGILPMKLFFMFKPPLRFFNLLFSLIAFVLLLVSIH